MNRREAIQSTLTGFALSGIANADQSTIKSDEILILRYPPGNQKIFQQAKEAAQEMAVRINRNVVLIPNNFSLSVLQKEEMSELIRFLQSTVDRE